MESEVSGRQYLIIRILPSFRREKSSVRDLVRGISSLARDGAFPILWNLPAALLSRDFSEDFLSLLKERTEKRGDQILSAGITGTPHVFLTPGEIRREYEDSRGYFRTFTAPAPFADWYFPFYPDPSRKEIREMYLSQGHFLSLLPSGDGDGSSRLRLPGGREMPARPLIFPGTAQVEPETPRTPQEEASRANGGEPEALVLTLTVRSRLSALGEDLYGLIASRGGPESFPALPEPAAPETGENPNRTSLPEILPPGGYWTPSWRQNFLDAPELPPEPPSQNLIADMLGSVTMEDEDFSVHFEKGRLKGLTLGRRALLPRKPAACRFSSESGSLPFLPPASYSFEDRYLRGLREIQPFRTADGTRGRLVSDYAFHRDFRQLLVSCTLEFPPIQTEELFTEYALQELLLFEGPEKELPITVRVDGGPGGDECMTDLTAEPEDRVLTGRRFSFIMGERVVSLGVPGDLPWPMVLPLRVERKRRRRRIWLNLWGSYRALPGRELSGLREHVSFWLWAGEGGAIPESTPEISAFPGGLGYGIGRMDSGTAAQVPANP